MSKVIEYYYSLASPFTFLGGARLETLAARHGVPVHYRPMILNDVFAVSGGLPLAKRVPQRRAYRLVELKRWSRALGVSLTLEPAHFPVDDSLAARMVIAATALVSPNPGHPAGALSNAILRAVWGEERNIAEPDTLLAIAAKEGLDGPALLEAAGTEAVQATYRANTDDAIAGGVFGAPTYVVDGELFWGQDRLDFLEQALTGG